MMRCGTSPMGISAPGASAGGASMAARRCATQAACSVSSAMPARRLPRIGRVTTTAASRGQIFSETRRARAERCQRTGQATSAMKARGRSMTVSGSAESMNLHSPARRRCLAETRWQVFT